MKRIALYSLGAVYAVVFWGGVFYFANQTLKPQAPLFEINQLATTATTDDNRPMLCSPCDSGLSIGTNGLRLMSLTPGISLF